LPWESYHAGVEDVIDAGDGRVLVLTNDRARPKGASAEATFLGAPVWTVRDGKVSSIEFYWDRAEGLAAAGLAE
jgi:ketosteroid isomerase-like protein